MHIDNARSLKADLLADAGPMAFASALPRAAARVRESPRAAKSEKTMAIGLTRQGSEFCLAVRIQKLVPGTDATLEYIRKRSKGEYEVRLIGEIAKQAPWHQKRNRPLRIGGSVAHRRVTAGTLGAFVTPRSGSGGEDWILSNNHVLANENNARRGDAIWQPGKADGGRSADAIGELGRFQPLKVTGNQVDAATAQLNDGVEYYYDWLEGIGPIAGVRTGPLRIGESVFKVGRTTETTEGRVSAIEVDDLTVGFDRGDLLFEGQIEIAPVGNEPFSLAGDSGSLIVDADQRAVGLLFAGNDVDSTYANPIELVLDTLKVDLVF